MKLLNIIHKVILEQVKDEGEVEDRDRRPDVEVDNESPTIEPEDREPEDREEDGERPRIGYWSCLDPERYPGCKRLEDGDIKTVMRFRFPFYQEQEACIEASTCPGERATRPTTTRPTTTRPTTTRPTTTTTTERPTTMRPEVRPQSDSETETQQTQPVAQTQPVVQTPEMSVKTEYDDDSKITNISKIQSKKYINIVKKNLKKQLSVQSPKVKQKLRQFNIKPSNISYLIPLSLGTGTLLSKMEMDGLNLPLMMVLYQNVDKLYKSMRENKPFTEGEAKPVSGPINYKNFWSWSNQVYDGWGPWLKQNVASNFPEISRNTFPSLSF